MKIELEPHVSAVPWRSDLSDLFLLQTAKQAQELCMCLMNTHYLPHFHSFSVSFAQSKVQFCPHRKNWVYSMLNLLISVWYCLQIHWKPTCPDMVVHSSGRCYIVNYRLYLEGRIFLGLTQAIFSKLIGIGVRLGFSVMQCCFLHCFHSFILLLNCKPLPVIVWEVNH